MKVGMKSGCFIGNFCGMMSKQSQIHLFLNPLAKSSRHENVPSSWAQVT